MARHSTSIFGVIFVSVIISQQCQLSFAQQRSVTCSQTAVKRGQSYGSILEDTQNRAHELDDSFGPIPDFIKYRRKRSHMVCQNLKNNCNLWKPHCMYVSKAEINIFKCSSSKGPAE